MTPHGASGAAEAAPLGERVSPGASVRPILDSALVPIAVIVVSLAIFGAIVAMAGANPLDVYYQMYRGAFGTWFSLQNTLLRAAPLMFAALCTALPARLGLVVIGAEGALVIGGLAAVMAAQGVSHGTPATVVICMLLAGFVAGGAWVAMAGALRLFRGVNETISSLLFAYIGIALFNHLVEGPLRDPHSLNKPSTVEIGAANMLGVIPGTDVHWGLLLGVGACVAAWVLMQRTVFGFAARIVGGNVRAALLSGLPVKRLVLWACFLGGGCAGVAGMVEVAAVHGRANASLIAGYGYTGILVAFIARHNPLAIIPVTVLLGGISASGGLLQRTAGLPDAAVNVLQGILFVVILASEAFHGRLPLRWPRAAGSAR